MYHTSTTTSSMPIPEFIQKYQDREKFMAFCKECPNYNNLWCCPPLQFDANELLQGFTDINLVAVKVIYDEETIKSANTAEKIKEITRRTLREVKDKLADTMLSVEREIPGSIGLASGGCYLCERCNRKDDLPCQQPEKMRYSIDSFGFDLTAITSDLLQIELKWPKDSLPEYYTLIHALLTKEPLGNRLDQIMIV
jgi:predicted metal-binding protein